MQRREVLAIGGIAAVLGGAKALAQNGGAAAEQARLIHVFSTADGQSHIEDLVIAPDAEAVPITRMTAGVYGGSAAAPAWHNAPRKQFAINMTGELEVEISDGTRRRIGPGDLVFLADTSGKGHVTRPLGPITNLFLHVPDDFDVVAWSRGGG